MKKRLHYGPRAVQLVKNRHLRSLSKHKLYEAHCAAPVIHQVIYGMLPKIAQHTKYHVYFTFPGRECQALFRVNRTKKSRNYTIPTFPEVTAAANRQNASVKYKGYKKPYPTEAAGKKLCFSTEAVENRLLRKVF